MDDCYKSRVEWRVITMLNGYFLACPDNNTAFYELLLSSCLGVTPYRVPIGRLELQQIKRDYARSKYIK